MENLSPYDLWQLQTYGSILPAYNGLYNDEDFINDNLSSAEQAFIFNNENFPNE